MEGVRRLEADSVDSGGKDAPLISLDRLTRVWRGRSWRITHVRTVSIGSGPRAAERSSVRHNELCPLVSYVWSVERPSPVLVTSSMGRNSQRRRRRRDPRVRDGQTTAKVDERETAWTLFTEHPADAARLGAIFALPRTVLVKQEALRAMPSRVGDLDVTFTLIADPDPGHDPTSGPPLGALPDYPWYGGQTILILPNDEKDCSTFWVHVAVPEIAFVEPADALLRHRSVVALADHIDDWVSLLQEWLDVLQFRGRRAYAQLQQETIARINFPDGKSVQLSTNRSTSHMTSQTVRFDDMALSPESLRFALSQTALNEKVPSARRLLGDALRAHHDGDLRTATLGWAAAAELALESMYSRQTQKSHPPTRDFASETLGGKVKRFESEGLALLAGLDGLRIQAELVNVRNDAAHGRDLNEAVCDKGFQLAAQLVDWAWPMPVEQRVPSSANSFSFVQANLGGREQQP